MKYDETGEGMDRNFLRFGPSLAIEGSCSLSKLGSSVFRSTVYTYETWNHASITTLRTIRFEPTDETKNNVEQLREDTSDDRSISMILSSIRDISRRYAIAVLLGFRKRSSIDRF